jgi:RNA-splicing ligase RtcB
MTAKEKAQQIYDKIYNGMESGVPKKYVLKCATILIDEMIDYIAEWADEEGAALHVIYLSQVKNEILKI